MEAILIVLAAILADNLLLSRLFGVESFFTATEKTSGSAIYGGLVTGVTIIAGTASLALYRFVFEPKYFDPICSSYIYIYNFLSWVIQIL